ncbi:TPA: hypothetical protein TZM69_002084, partial [Streptococcus suis]|nr:hypothetical protein [Streptococcus suis]
PKFVENIVQAISRDLLAYAMRMLGSKKIVGHVHDEVILEAESRQEVDDIAASMANTPDWMKNINLRADGYECDFYQKD